MGNCLTGSEAVFGFCAWLTTRKEKTIMGGSEDVVPVLELIQMFCEENKLPNPRENYTDFLAMPKEDGKGD